MARRTTEIHERSRAQVFLKQWFSSSGRRKLHALLGTRHVPESRRDIWTFGIVHDLGAFVMCSNCNRYHARDGPETFQEYGRAWMYCPWYKRSKNRALAFIGGLGCLPRRYRVRGALVRPGMLARQWHRIKYRYVMIELLAVPYRPGGTEYLKGKARFEAMAKLI